MSLPRFEVFSKGKIIEYERILEYLNLGGVVIDKQNDYIIAIDETLLVFVEKSILKELPDRYYYVVEAVPHSSRRTMFVLTAYKNKNDTNAEVGDAESLNPDVQNALQSNVSSNIIISKDK